MASLRCRTAAALLRPLLPLSFTLFGRPCGRPSLARPPSSLHSAFTHLSRGGVQQLGVMSPPSGVSNRDPSRFRVFIKGGAELRCLFPYFPFCRDQNCLVYPLLRRRMHYSFGVISTNGSLIFRLSHQTFFFLPPFTSCPPRLRFTLLLPAAMTSL